MSASTAPETSIGPTATASSGNFTWRTFTTAANPPKISMRGRTRGVALPRKANACRQKLEPSIGSDTRHSVEERDFAGLERVFAAHHGETPLGDELLQDAASGS